MNLAVVAGGNRLPDTNILSESQSQTKLRHRTPARWTRRADLNEWLTLTLRAAFAGRIFCRPAVVTRLPVFNPTLLMSSQG
jgi:hypothetical protein